MGGQSVPGRRMRMRKGREVSPLVGAVNVGFYVINLKFIPVLAAPSVRRSYQFAGIAGRSGARALSERLDLIHSKLCIPGIK